MTAVAPVPDPVAVVSWPTAAVAIAGMVIAGVMQAINLVMTHQARMAAAEAATQTRPHDGDSAESQRDVIESTQRVLAEHIADDQAWKRDDAAWKRMVEERLPQSPRTVSAT